MSQEDPLHRAENEILRLKRTVERLNRQLGETTANEYAVVSDYVAAEAALVKMKEALMPENDAVVARYNALQAFREWQEGGNDGL